MAARRYWTCLIVVMIVMIGIIATGIASAPEARGDFASPPAGVDQERQAASVKRPTSGAALGVHLDPSVAWYPPPPDCLRYGPEGVYYYPNGAGRWVWLTCYTDGAPSLYGWLPHPVYDDEGYLRGISGVGRLDRERARPDFMYLDEGARSFFINTIRELESLSDHYPYHAKGGDEYFSSWKNTLSQIVAAIDEIDEGKIKRCDFEPFFIRFLSEYDKLYNYMVLLWEKKYRIDDSCPTHHSDPDIVDQFCSTLARHPSISYMYSARAWEQGVDPWAYMEEVAQSSRPVPFLGTGSCGTAPGAADTAKP